MNTFRRPGNRLAQTADKKSDDPVFCLDWAVKYMDGGQIDGQEVVVEVTLNRAPGIARRSPHRSPIRRKMNDLNNE
ncbi:unnamed protein product [Caenorhabditis auriculariae]|uniref:Uncharacterized protein n=1 Tax=Caenorhabditis auriculariae TaxID=2777116 RepID=A0A8S1GVI1_9PELO|nr:unnamed protein product [Caenorhabditis auriculariae]